MAILYTGCTKDEETDPNQSDNREAEVDATKDDALADKLFSELTDITDEAMRNNEKSYKGIVLDTIFMGPCVTVTIDTLSFPFTITIDFGDVNCECNDGKWRRGKIHVEHSGPYWAVGTVITTSLEDYYVNNHLLTGTKIATNQGLNTNNNPTWTIHVDGQVVKPDGGVITWVGDRMREWAQGHNTPFLWWDDVYMLTGSHNVVASNGSTLSATIIEGLQVALNCYWIEAGIIELQHSDLPLIVLDYGQGVCDDDAVVYIDGTPYPIKL
ncbi:MAG: hypothetical protein DRJ15_06720 [Bacteroidetes bacterium]|nr:MAG: hypothetical protein DRI83_00945 [Bacteroidota bacterium]RLD80571.1 MAG: hypothetical protein DRJ15_06720 [Bacteroidota bacterium]